MNNKKIIRNSIIFWVVIMALGGLITFASNKISISTVFSYMLLVIIGGFLYGFITAGIIFFFRFVKSKFIKTQAERKEKTNHSDNEEIPNKKVGKSQFIGLFKSNKKLSKYEKEELYSTIGGIIISGIISFFVWKYVLVPFETFPFSFMRLTRAWTIGIAVFLFFSSLGMWRVMSNTTNFFIRKNKKLSDLEENKKDDNLVKIQELKKLKDSGAITDKEFQKKKEELLNKV